jgi:hypothetical protein
MSAGSSGSAACLPGGPAASVARSTLILPRSASPGRLVLARDWPTGASAVWRVDGRRGGSGATMRSADDGAYRDRIGDPQLAKLVGAWSTTARDSPKHLDALGSPLVARAVERRPIRSQLHERCTAPSSARRGPPLTAGRYRRSLPGERSHPSGWGGASHSPAEQLYAGSRTGLRPSEPTLADGSPGSTGSTGARAHPRRCRARRSPTESRSPAKRPEYRAAISPPVLAGRHRAVPGPVQRQPRPPLGAPRRMPR